MKKVLIGFISAIFMVFLASCNTCYTCEQVSVTDGDDTSLRGQHTTLEIREVCSRSERRKLLKSEQNNAGGNVFWVCDKNKDLEDSAEDIERINNGGN